MMRLKVQVMYSTYNKWIKNTVCMCWMWYSPLTGATRQPRQIGHNPTWPWGSPIPASPLSLVHLHRSEEQMSKSEIKKGRNQMNSYCLCVCGGLQLTSSLVWRVSPLANVIWTHGMDSAAWWGMGHAYFTTLERYLTCTLSVTQHGHKTGDEKRKSSASWNGNCRDSHTAKGSILDPVYVSRHKISAFASFPVKTRGWCACSQGSGRSIKHLVKHYWFSSLAHGSRRSSHLTIFLMALACHIALTNSVYLQQHHATLCTCCQLVRFCPSSQNISSCRNPKHESIPSYPGSRRLGARPIHRTATGSLNTTVKYGFSVIGGQGYIETSWRAAHFSCSALSITTPWLKWERRGREREGQMGGTWGKNVL